MSGPETVNNTAGPHSFVGAQVGQMHDSNIYVINPGDPPESDYKVGVRYLESGVPGKAHEHLERAYARGIDSPALHFHRALAILGKRSYRDLSKKDRALLKDLERRTRSLERDEHKKALEVIFALLSCVDGSGGDSEAAMARLKALPSEQRAPILRHLGLVLTGGMKQELWKQIQRNAHKAHLNRDRNERVWSYFEPTPAKARARHPEPKSTTGWDVFLGILLAGAALPVVAVILKNALTHGDFLSLLSCLAILTLGPAAAWDLCSWHHKHRRRVALEREYGYLRSHSPPPKGGFTDRVEEAFDHYFFLYAPEPEHRATWTKETAGVRRSLRDEVARTYRETEIEAGKVRWLIRFMVRDVRRRLREGKPLEPREIHAVTLAAKARCVALFLLWGVATGTVLTTAFQQAPVVTAGCVLLTVVIARFALPLWLRIHSERRRFQEQTQERQGILDAREAEYERWKGKLEGLRPEEKEMEGWLDADKTLILDQALRHYRLAWYEVVAHAFLPTPKRPCKSARVPRGPWRYSRYEIRIFLVTDEGVREATADLDFERGTWQLSARNNYRFDALSSVQVEIESTRSYTLNITLTNGPTEQIPPPPTTRWTRRHGARPRTSTSTPPGSPTRSASSKASPPKVNPGSSGKPNPLPRPTPTTPRVRRSRQPPETPCLGGRNRPPHREERHAARRPRPARSGPAAPSALGVGTSGAEKGVRRTRSSSCGGNASGRPLMTDPSIMEQRPKTWLWVARWGDRNRWTLKARFTYHLAGRTPDHLLLYGHDAACPGTTPGGAAGAKYSVLPGPLTTHGTR